jgi:hypothetical protein
MEREIVKGDPGLRRILLGMGLGLAVAGTLALTMAADAVTAIASLSQRSRGEALALLAAFVAPFVLLAVAGGLDALGRSRRTLREGRFPPSGMRMVRDTPVIRGPLARVLGLLGGVLGTLLLVGALLLVATTYRMGRVLWYGCPSAPRATASR